MGASFISMAKMLKQLESSHQGVLKVQNFYRTKHFRFRSLNEAHACAQELASFCPNPAMAAMGFTEIFVNAVEHGNLGIDYNDKACFENQQEWLDEVNRRLLLKENIRKYVQVELQIMPDQIRVCVSDCGYGFDWEKFQNRKDVPLTSFHGRGILIATELAFDELIFMPPGNRVDCIIYQPLSNLPDIFHKHFR